MFYTYYQNNSGGSWRLDKKRGIAHKVIIEADFATEANIRAEEVGLYFDGNGDCSCCGNRWDEHWRDEDGTATPEVYGQPAREYKHDQGWNSVAIHYKDGRVEQF